MFKKMINFFKDEEGATMVEYALMLALIAVVCVGAVPTYWRYNKYYIRSRKHRTGQLIFVHEQIVHQSC